MFVSLINITCKKTPSSRLVTREGTDAATASGLHQLQALKLVSKRFLPHVRGLQLRVYM